jgi:hypothetical protein
MLRCGIPSMGVPPKNQRRLGRRLLMRKVIDRSFLSRLLQTTGPSLTSMKAGAAGARAEIVIARGFDGAAGAALSLRVS